MSYYECKRCGHITKQKIEMIRHLNRKNKCLRVINSYHYDESDIDNQSLIKHTTNQNNIKKQNINNEIQIKKIINQEKNQDENEEEKQNENNLNKDIIEKSNVIINNDLKNKLNKNITENKSKTSNKFVCDICNKIFTRKYNLNRHRSKCSLDKIEIRENENNSDSSHFNNTTNNFNTINNNYNKNLFVNFNVEPFDNDWDVSRITKFTRHSILLSKIMYSNLLDNILQNEKNLNVLIEKDTNTGIVYKNNVDKFITMNIQDIIDKSMEKLNKHLKDFYNESMKDDEFIIMDKIFQEQIVNIENKYNEFKNNDEIKKKVEEFITQIYDKKKENAIKLYNNTLLKDNEDNGY